MKKKCLKFPDSVNKNLVNLKESPATTMQIILIQPGSQAALSLAQTHQFVSSSSSTNGEGSEIDWDLSGEEKPTRKRQRLDHMTEQEKFLRRKMKNRVAAQTARDKKKAKMDELEEIVINLREENNRLKAENQHLLAENARLSGIPTPHVEEVSKSMERMYPVKSAALINGPLPQGQGYIPFLVLKMLLHLMLILQSPAAQLKLNGLKMSAVLDNAHSQYLSDQQLKNMPTSKHQQLSIKMKLKHPP